MLVFGGIDSDRFGDTWSYVPDAGAFRVTSIIRNSGSITISFDSLPGRRCTLWYSDTMAAGSWQNTGAPALAGTGGPLSFLQPIPAASRRFYRVQGEL
jgi:hypothetical protein